MPQVGVPSVLDDEAEVTDACDARRAVLPHHQQQRAAGKVAGAYRSAPAEAVRRCSGPSRGRTREGPARALPGTARTPRPAACPSDRVRAAQGPGDVPGKPRGHWPEASPPPSGGYGIHSRRGRPGSGWRPAEASTSSGPLGQRQRQRLLDEGDAVHLVPAQPRVGVKASPLPQRREAVGRAEEARGGGQQPRFRRAAAAGPPAPGRARRRPARPSAPARRPPAGGRRAAGDRSRT